MKWRSNTSDIPWRLMGSLFLLALFLMGYYLLKPGPYPLYVITVNIIAIFYTLGLGALCMRGSHKLIQPTAEQQTRATRRRFAPALLGITLWVFTLSQIAWLHDTLSFQQPLPFPSLQHFILLAMYPLLIAAVLVLPTGNLSPLARLRLFLDSLLVIIALTTLLYYFLLAPIFDSGKGTLLEKVMTSLPPLGTLLVMFCLLLVSLRSGEKALRPVLIMLGLVVMGLFVANSIHLSELLVHTYNQFSAGNALLFFAAILLVGAAQTIRRIVERGKIHPVSADRPLEQVEHKQVAERWKNVLPSILVLVYGLIVCWIWITGGEKHFHGQILPIYAGSFAVLLLLVLRQLLAMYEVNRLRTTLQGRNLSLAFLNTQLEQQATTDPLTHLPNHRAVTELLNSELVHAAAQHTSCSLLFIDLDHFKIINDSYSHLVGDAVLRQFSSLLKDALRPGDHVGRWGGEEFVAIVPGTGPADAEAIAERVRLRVERHLFPRALRLTCSLGVATYPDDAQEYGHLLMLADTAMYAAKHTGRNQTCMARDPVVMALGLTVKGLRTTQTRNILETVDPLMALVDTRDLSAGQHGRRVAALSLLLARALGLNEDDAYAISLGGLLHDLGKMALPDTLLREQHHLSAEAERAIQRHPIAGAEILMSVPALQEVANIVRSHHERMDGSGYPDQLAGEAIPLGARIVAVADAYDKLIQPYPSQPAQSPTEAFRIIRQHSGTRFDPRTVEALARVLTEEPSPPLRRVA